MLKFTLLGAAALAALAVGLPVVLLAAIFGGPRSTAGIPASALSAYQAAAATCPGLSWTVVAAIGEVESDHGRSTLPGVQSGANSAGAEGPMQMLPATFAAYAPAGADPYDLPTEALAAARLLCADGADNAATLAQAIWNYNHSWDYVDQVVSWASTYGLGA